MEFVCRVGSPEGRVLEEIREARSERAVRQQFETRGYRVFEVRRKGLRLSLPDLRRRKPITEREFLLFNQELAGLLKAGLPLLQALDLVLERQRNRDFREILVDVRDRVRGGEELSQAFMEHGDRFPRLYGSTLMAGERTGELETVIRRFVRYLKIVMETRRRVVTALVYPTLLVGLSTVMVGVMVVYVIPKFQVFYDAMDVELPALTRGILAFSLFVQERFLWLVGGVLALIVVARRARRTEAGGAFLDRFKLRIPLAGAILHRFAVSEFCRSLSTLLAGGMPLVPSLSVATDSVGNVWLRQRLQPVVPKVREGKALYQALEESGEVGDLAVDLVKVGEATGSLDEMLSNVSDFFDEEIETRIQRLLSLVEPVMLVFMGLLVAMLLVSMYLPLFSILGQLQ
ncbi:MAG TPA: type II secretion system F family protein [Thermoanaerobaculia bacterium]|nr:type II secretion system F family protein [Thermoanaerobaculia bacterium]